MTSTTLLTVAAAFHPQKKGWVNTVITLIIGDESVTIDECNHAHMDDMDGWVFNINNILREYKLVDVDTYGVYDKNTKTLKLVEARLFDDMKEL